MMLNPLIKMIIQNAMQNPMIANDPVKRHYLEVITSGNSAEGRQIAQNLCQAHGVSTNDASANAKKFFNL